MCVVDAYHHGSPSDLADPNFLCFKSAVVEGVDQLIDGGSGHRHIRAILFDFDDAQLLFAESSLLEE